MIGIIDCGCPTIKELEYLVDQFDDHTTIPLLDLNAEPSGIDALIISSSSIQLTDIDPDLYLEKLAFIKESKKPVFGIDFGNRLLGLLYGSYIYKTRPINGWQLIESFEDSVILDKLPYEFDMMANYTETSSVPPGFKLIASSDACITEVIEHVEKPQFGVQFLPELSGNYGAILIDNFIRSIKKADN
jgi:GMP synthase (glutamine-hydrolysing)